MANRAIKYRLKPTPEQMNMFARTFGCCRKVWNLMLADETEHYEETGEFWINTPASYKTDYSFLKEVDSLALCNEQQFLQQAFKNFFRDSKTFGFPHFKSAKSDKRSYTTNCVNGNIVLESKHIRLPKVGKVKVVVHRTPKADWKLKSVTVSQDPDGKYYASVLFEFDEVVGRVPISDNAIGFDYKSDGLYTDSNGNLAPNTRKNYRNGQKKVAKAMRKLSRKQKGSKNYQKQKRKVAKLERKIANQRKDDLHKLSTAIAKQYDIVCVESLNMKALANRWFHNGKATYDNGWGMFLTMLEYKLAERGKHFVQVDKWFASSQLCSSCGYKQKLPLRERTYVCPECGLIIDRDYNAALNILNEGLRILREA